MRGDEKDVFTIWFHLRQQTLHYETAAMLPSPEENPPLSTSTCCGANASKALWRVVRHRRRNAIFLVGQIANDAVDDDELDRILEFAVQEWTERFFPPGDADRVRHALQG